MTMKRIYSLFAIIILVMCFALRAQARKKLVVFWNFDEKNAYNNHLKNAVAEFEKRHNVSISLVKRRPLSTDELHEAYISIFSSGSTTPDVFQIDGIRIPEFAELNSIVDITDHLPRNERGRFFSNSIEEVSWKGRLWAFPLFSAVGMLAYRKDILDKHGIPPPKNWKELIDAAGKLQSENFHGYVGQMANYEGLVCNALEFFWSNGGNPKFEVPSDLTTAQTVEGLQLMVDLVNKYRITPKDQLKFKEDEGFQLLMSGRALFTRQWPGDWLSPDYDRYPRTITHVGVMPMPRGPSGTRGVSTLGGWSVAINRNSRNVDLAIKFARFVTNEANQKQYFLKWGHLPTRRALYRDRDVVRNYPWLKDIYPIVVNAKLRPRTPFYPEISEIMQRELHLALEQKIQPQQALERIEKKIASFLKSVNRAGNK